mmetsp:Transcript_62392/g.173994  ORF Transcript_62392/g.173994 Transcript_62392/m.173994 type:complete len:214 (-) Transcript_62392:36-677(-)
MKTSVFNASLTLCTFQVQSLNCTTIVPRNVLVFSRPGRPGLSSSVSLLNTVCSSQAKMPKPFSYCAFTNLGSLPKGNMTKKQYNVGSATPLPNDTPTRGLAAMLGPRKDAFVRAGMAPSSVRASTFPRASGGDRGPALSPVVASRFHRWIGNSKAVAAPSTAASATPPNQSNRLERCMGDPAPSPADSSSSSELLLGARSQREFTTRDDMAET